MGSTMGDWNEYTNIEVYWTCSKCGACVRSGDFHECGYSSTPCYNYPYCNAESKLDEILAELREIKKLLRKPGSVRSVW